MMFLPSLDQEPIEEKVETAVVNASMVQVDGEAAAALIENSSTSQEIVPPTGPPPPTGVQALIGVNDKLLETAVEDNSQEQLIKNKKLKQMKKKAFIESTRLTNAKKEQEQAVLKINIEKLEILKLEKQNQLALAASVSNQKKKELQKILEQETNQKNQKKREKLKILKREAADMKLLKTYISSVEGKNASSKIEPHETYLSKHSNKTVQDYENLNEEQKLKYITMSKKYNLVRANKMKAIGMILEANFSHCRFFYFLVLFI